MEGWRNELAYNHTHNPNCLRYLLGSEKEPGDLGGLGMKERRKNTTDRRWANNGGAMGAVGQERQMEWIRNDDNENKRDYTQSNNGRREWPK